MVGESLLLPASARDALEGVITNTFAVTEKCPVYHLSFSGLLWRKKDSYDSGIIRVGRVRKSVDFE